MNLIKLQKQVKPWADYNFPTAKRWEPLIGAMEELGELSHSFLKLHQGIRKGEDHRAKMEDAVGDIIVYLADFCNRNDLNLASAVQMAWTEARQRDWQKYPKDGTTE